MGKVKPAGLVGLAAVAIGIGAAVKFMWWDKRPQEAKASTQIGKLVLPDAPEASLSGAAAMLPFPSTKSVNVQGGVEATQYVMGWNSQIGLMLATGGKTTTKGSLMEAAGVNLTIVRENNCDVSIAALVKFAQDYKADPTTPGVLCSYMGDGMPTFFNTLTRALEPLGPEYQPVAFYAMGKSYGEDKLMGPPSWKTRPQDAIGKTVACYLRDGDMNILLKWAGDNNLPVNPDETTYDSLAINLVAATDYLDAAAKYIVGDYKEPRSIIRDGKKLSETVDVGVDAVATWTPGDVNIAQKRGGLVNIASTKDYSTQMPNITIGIRKWLNDNRAGIEGYIAALAQAGDQVRSFNEARKYACEIQAKVYDEQNGDYWYKYYNGVTERDAQGKMVELGGSMVFNLHDAVNYFGMGDDGIDRYKVVYTTFGDILSKMYPELMPSYPPYKDIMDKSFIATVQANHPELMEGKALPVNYATTISEPVSNKSYSIQFETGSSRIKEASYPDLDEILSSAVVAENLNVGVSGHTDNVGNPESNQRLSEQRAEAVRQYLIDKGLSPRRIESAGYGEDRPIAENTTSAGKARNRRVEITLGR